MITAKEYFEHYIAWPSTVANGKQGYESFAAMDNNTLRYAAGRGDAGALEELGERYLFGLENVQADVAQACVYLKQSADAGHPDAMNLLAEVYKNDAYGRKDLDAYFSQLEKAAERGCWKSMFNLACAYYKGKSAYEGHGVETDRAAALDWSIRCVEMTHNLLAIFFTTPCSKKFQEYLEGVYQAFIQSVMAASKQLISGDGVAADLPRAEKLLTMSQAFHKKYMGQEHPAFQNLLAKCQ